MVLHVNKEKVMNDIIQRPSASALSHKRPLEAKRDFAIERLVAAHERFDSGDKGGEECIDLNEAIDNFTDAQMTLNSGIQELMNERMNSALDCLIEAWGGDDLGELNAAADALALLNAPRRLSY
jgi:hypothetical protein